MMSFAYIAVGIFALVAVVSVAVMAVALYELWSLPDEDYDDESLDKNLDNCDACDDKICRPEICEFCSCDSEEMFKHDLGGEHG